MGRAIVCRVGIGGEPTRTERSPVKEATIPTWNLLPSLGFQPDANLDYSDIRPCLSLDFGNFKLSAVAVTSPHSGEIISFSGIRATRDTLAQIEFELPRRVTSLKQCAAWIVWSLDQQWDCRMFRPARAMDWFDEGRRHRSLLPWVMSQAEFDARPQCTVRRDWLRLALKTLGEQLASLLDSAEVVLSFDGAVFSIRCDSKLIAFPGEGSPWTVGFWGESQKSPQPSKAPHARVHLRVGLGIAHPI